MNDRWLLTSNKEDLEPKHIAKRDMWFEKHIPLMVAYWFKEGLRDIYKSKDRKEAFERYSEWETGIPDNMPHFKAVAETINNCKQEVFNYFLHRYTNAFTESINNVIKKVEKVGVGYSLDVLRAKVLYGTTATKRPKWGESHFYTLDKFMGDNYETDLSKEKPQFEGQYVDITTLLQIMDGENF
jgi:hypothetical protein